MAHRSTHRPGRSTAAAAALTALCVGVAGLSSATLGSASAADDTRGPGARYAKKTPTSTGFGGAVSSVDPEASKIGLRVLAKGGNAVDAAVATAAALGVTEPYSAGIGGGGYFVYYDARTKKVRTIDGRETAPMAMPKDAFIDPATGEPYPFTPDLVTSGVSVGVPGTLATWQRALERWGTDDLRTALKPAQRLASRGFKVDQTFHDQTKDNQERFEAYKTTPKLFLPGGKAPRVGSVFKNPDLAATYRLIGRKGMRVFYEGRLGREIVRAVRKPATSRKTELPVPRGFMKRSDLKRYEALDQRPTKSRYRGYQVFGMAPSSSGGTTVGEALNIMERYDLAGMSPEQALHHYLEATALAFADRGAYLGDPAKVDVPVKKLLDDTFAVERACQIDSSQAMTKPVAAGDVSSYDGYCATTGRTADGNASDTENVETTNLTVTDRWGNVVEYTLTIEQTGGSGMLVKDRGFLLNNELTDFSTTFVKGDPNRIQPGKRPRSSMSPTIVLKNRKPVIALGSPGGSTIITTVTQMLFNYLDREMSIVDAIEAPRASQRNTAAVTAEPAFIDAYGAQLTALGHTLKPAGDAFTSAAEIGAATAIEFGRRGKVTAVSEPSRRGGGSALVVARKR